jgi:hypothetical protein
VRLSASEKEGRARLARRGAELEWTPVSTARAARRPADTLEPIPADWATSPDLAIRIRARDARGAPTDDRYPVQTMLVGSPFLEP